MATAGFSAKLTFRFIDESNKILERFEKERSRRLRRGGSLVRTIMRRSIRYRAKKKSEPGQVPFAHTRGFGLRTIFYAYDPSTQTVVIGPVVGSDRTNAPAALEFGGQAMVKVSRRMREKTGKKRRRSRIRKRPYSFPALEKASDKYPEVLKGMF